MREPAARAVSRHFGWSRDHEPCVSVAPGGSVEFVLADPSDGQLRPGSAVSELDSLDWARVPPLCGPVAVDGAAPGDALRVTTADVFLGGWGWTEVVDQPNRAVAFYVPRAVFA